jgi:superfamily I DNA/RNA helicase
MREGHHFVSSEATTNFFGRNRISPDEADALMLVMLRNARRIVQYPDGRRMETATQHDWLENIKGRYLIQVFVDEATDLSAVQLACTIELANPRLRSWFACGDLRQRITANGLQDRSELDWLNTTAGIKIDIREIDIGYRQSQRLRDLADALAALDADGKVTTKSPRGSEEADVWPLLGEGLSEGKLGAWLAERIDEVERAIGRLPSIAVFVDGDDLIDPLVNATQSILAERNIPIVGCKEGRVVGDAREVRVFDIQHIKGLEFEAVFFVGIDGLARRIPDLFQRFFYVGVTRAATYLGLTCEDVLPARLEPVRSHFRTDTWA